jgi:hypothetical protein
MLVAMPASQPWPQESLRHSYQLMEIVAIGKFSIDIHFDCECRFRRVG